MTVAELECRMGAREVTEWHALFLLEAEERESDRLAQEAERKLAQQRRA